MTNIEIETLMVRESTALLLGRYYVRQLMRVEEFIEMTDALYDDGLIAEDDAFFEIMDMARSAALSYYRGACKAGAARQAQAVLHIDLGAL